MTTEPAEPPPRCVSPIWVVALLGVCLLPGALMACGVDFASAAAPAPGPGARLETESAFRLLRGSFTHTLLEWTAACAALMVCALTFARFRITRDTFLPIVGIALACAGAMDVFHTLAADRLIRAVADNHELIPFTWAICRLFSALLVLAGLSIYLWRRRAGEAHGEFGRIACLLSVALIALSCAVVAAAARSSSLPQTMFPEALIKRPYDLAPLILFGLCAAVVFPTYLKRRDALFPQLLFLSLIPQIATQVYMTFGSSELFDSAFNVAHGLKVLAYAVPAVGLVVEHVWTSERSAELAAELQYNTYRAEAFMDAASEGIVVIDPQGIILTANPVSNRMFGYEEDELLGQNVSVIAGGPHGAAHDGYLERFLKTGESHLLGRPREVPGRRKDGTEFPLRLSVSPAGLSGELLFIGILDDLTAEKELQAHLNQSQKLESIGQLAAGIAHEINTPTQYTTDNVRFLSDAADDLLSVIAAASAIVEAQAAEGGEPSTEVAHLRETLAEADVEFLLDEIPKAIEHSLDGLSSVASIVRAMKEFSHPGQTELMDVDLGHNITTAVTVSRSEWKYVAELELEIEPDLPLVPCLAGEFNQVILNLIVNAAHAISDRNEREGREKGHITISVVVAGDGVEVRVQDNGCGIPESIRSRVFDPFFTTKDVGKGTGQGLAIARTVIVEKHGGTLTVESEVGEGTTFVLHIPGASVPGEVAAE